MSQTAEDLLVPEIDLADRLMQADVQNVPALQHGIQGDLHDKGRLAQPGARHDGAELTRGDNIVLLLT